MYLKAIIRAVLPRWAIVGMKLQRIFFNTYGHNRRVNGMPVDGEGRHQPWLTYPVIEHINGLDLRDKDVFEFGAGASTIFWAERAKSVTSVELDSDWWDILRKSVPKNVELVHEPDGAKYARFPLTLAPRKFDVVVVDGAQRFESAKTALRVLAPGGMIVLDNAEWYPNTADVLSNADLIEVRLSGFSPINAFTETSSIFLSRDFAFSINRMARQRPKGGRALVGGALDDGV